MMLMLREWNCIVNSLSGECDGGAIAPSILPCGQHGARCKSQTRRKTERDESDALAPYSDLNGERDYCQSDHQSFIACHLLFPFLPRPGPNQSVIRVLRLSIGKNPVKLIVLMGQSYFLILMIVTSTINKTYDQVAEVMQQQTIPPYTPPLEPHRAGPEAKVDHNQLQRNK
jgi:hypothetical protein